MKPYAFIILIVVLGISAYIIYGAIKKSREGFLDRTYSISCLDYLENFRKWDLSSLNKNQREILLFLDSINDDRFGNDKKLQFTRNHCVFPKSLIQLFNDHQDIKDLENVPKEFNIEGKLIDLNKINTLNEFKELLTWLYSIYKEEIYNERIKRDKLIQNMNQEIVKVEEEKENLEAKKRELERELQAEKDNVYCITDILTEIQNETNKISNIDKQIEKVTECTNYNDKILTNSKIMASFYNDCDYENKSIPENIKVDESLITDNVVLIASPESMIEQQLVTTESLIDTKKEQFINEIKQSANEIQKEANKFIPTTMSSIPLFSFFKK